MDTLLDDDRIVSLNAFVEEMMSNCEHFISLAEFVFDIIKKVDIEQDQEYYKIYGFFKTNDIEDYFIEYCKTW